MEKVLFQEGIFEVISEEKHYKIQKENKIVKRKYVRRPPGVRAIIINDEGKILLSKEYRYELEKFDYRLPGGKVFDILDEYKTALSNNTIEESANHAVKKEVKEEIGFIISNPELYTISHAGSSIVWDLYYFIIKDYEIIPKGQELEEDEVIEGYIWKSPTEIINMCLNKEIHEERSIGVLLTYILKNIREKTN